MKLHEKYCTTRKHQKDLESNQEEENQPDGQPLIEQPGSPRQEEIELKVKLESPTGKESNQCGRKELAAESKDNEHVSEHNKARQSQGGGLETGLDQRIEGKEEEQVGLEPTAGERCSSTMSGFCNCLPYILHLHR